MDELKYEYHPRDIDFAKTAQLLSGYHSRWPNLWLIILAVSGLVLVISIFRMFQMGQNTGLILLPWILVYGFTIPYALMMVRENNRLIRLVEQSDWRQGLTQITLSKSGIKSIHPAYEISVNWGQVSDIITDTKDNIFFILSPSDYIPCPNAALPSDMTCAKLLEQIAKWR